MCNDSIVYCDCGSHVTKEILVDQATCHPEDSTENIHRGVSEL